MRPQSWVWGACMRILVRGACMRINTVAPRAMRMQAAASAHTHGSSSRAAQKHGVVAPQTSARMLPLSMQQSNSQRQVGADLRQRCQHGVGVQRACADAAAAAGDVDGHLAHVLRVRGAPCICMRAFVSACTCMHAPVRMRLHACMHVRKRRAWASCAHPPFCPPSAACTGPGWGACHPGL